MQLPTRRVLFWASAAVFAVLAPLVVGYALGYRLDLAGGGIVRTGALVVETEPGGAAVIIDGALARHTGTIFNGTALIRDLAPRVHRIRIEKPGYHPWEKEIEIYPAVVTEVRNVRLWPLKPIDETIGELAATGARVVPETVQFSPDGTHLLWAAEPAVRQGRGAPARAWLAQRSSGDVPAALTLPAGVVPDEARVRWSSDSRFLIVEAGTAWWRLDRDRLDDPVALPPIPAPRVLLDAATALAIDGTGILSVYQLTSSSTQAISRVAVIPPPSLDDELIAPNVEHIALRTREGTLRIFNPDEKTFVGVANGVVDARFSPDGTRLLWRTNRELWVRTADTDELITRFADPIAAAIWEARGAQVLFSVGGTLKAIELDRQSGRIITDLTALPASALALDRDKTSVLAVRAGSLVRIRFP